MAVQTEMTGDGFEERDGYSDEFLIVRVNVFGKTKDKIGYRDEIEEKLRLTVDPTIEVVRTSHDLRKICADAFN